MRAVVFDMDGLMFNTEDVYTAVGTEVLRRRGLEFTAELKQMMMGLRPQPAFEIMIGHCNLRETWQEIAAESNRLFIDLLPARLAPMPGLFELLAAMERTAVPKAIATSSSRVLAAACLEPFQLAGRFQFILAAEDVSHGKPHPEVYLSAADRFGIPPAEMAVLEDSQNGCLAGSASGAFTVAVPGHHSRSQDFSSASMVADGLADPRLYRALGLPAARSEK
jgi:pseudouridine 5'-phosphatase